MEELEVMLSLTGFGVQSTRDKWIYLVAPRSLVERDSSRGSPVGARAYAAFNAIDGSGYMQYWPTPLASLEVVEWEQGTPLEDVLEQMAQAVLITEGNYGSETKIIS
jgi:hypothetical protein